MARAITRGFTEKISGDGGDAVYWSREDGDLCLIEAKDDPHSESFTESDEGVMIRVTNHVVTARFTSEEITFTRYAIPCKPKEGDRITIVRQNKTREFNITHLAFYDSGLVVMNVSEVE